jgi:hypothetical protein
MKQRFEIIETDAQGNSHLLSGGFTSPVDAVLAIAFAGLPENIQSRQVREVGGDWLWEVYRK